MFPVEVMICFDEAGNRRWYLGNARDMYASFAATGDFEPKLLPEAGLAGLRYKRNDGQCRLVYNGGWDQGTVVHCMVVRPGDTVVLAFIDKDRNIVGPGTTIPQPAPLPSLRPSPPPKPVPPKPVPPPEPAPEPAALRYLRGAGQRLRDMMMAPQPKP